MSKNEHLNSLQRLLELAKARSIKIRTGNPFSSDLQAADILDALVKEVQILMLENEILRKRQAKKEDK